jgi:glycosyltransferase involved in cell wall biosynthesis
MWSRPGLYALVVPEAMSCGTPVIVSNVGALPYFIENNKNGFVFKDRDTNDLRDKLNIIIKNKKLAETMGRNGRKLVELKYNWQVIAKNVRKIYSNKT